MPKPDPSASAATVRVKHLVALVLWAVGILLALRFFDAIRLIGLGFLGAAIIASALRPLRKIFPGPRWWSALLSALLPAVFIGGLLVLLSWMLSEPVRRELSEWPRIHQAINDQLAYWSQRLGLGRTLTTHDLVIEIGRSLGQNFLASTTSAASNVLLAAMLVFFGAIYLLAGDSLRLLDLVLPLLPAQRRPQFRAAVQDLPSRLRWWLIGSMIAMVVTGLATYAGYWIISLPFAGPLALLAGVAELVPTFGPMFAFLVALLLAATRGAESVAALLVVYVCIQGLESYILQPYVMKKAVDMPPVLTLFSIVLWSTILGLPGLVLAIPINLVIGSFVDQFLIRPRNQPAGDDVTV